MALVKISRVAARPATDVVLRYGTAVISVLLALGTALSLRHYDLPSPFTSFSFAAIAVTFWYAGTGPGLLALVLSFLARRHFPPPLSIESPFVEPYLIIYGIFGALVGWFSASRRRAERLLKEAHDNLELRVARRTNELAGANEELQAIHAELRSEKDRLKELTDKLAQEKLYLEDEIRADAYFEEIVGKSTELRRVLKLVETVAATDSTVLIYGETGTGKELSARAIHNLSPRHSRTFVKLNCAAIPSGLLESELFGHEKGAFTGALMQKRGRFELADHGTLFLDEIGDISLDLQPKLLRALQEREFERLGSTKTMRVDVRLIAATHRDLQGMIRNNQFREDLFYRLNVCPIEIPPLRERREDIPLLVHYFVLRFSRQMQRRIKSVPKQAMEALVNHDWPGNIRELENFIERCVIFTQGDELNVPGTELKKVPVRSATLAASSFEQAERQVIIEALRAASGRVSGQSGAAERLGLKRTTLQNKMRKLNISRVDYAE